MEIRILAVGDVVGGPGLAFLSKRLRGLQKHLGADFTVVNGENAAGTGLTPRQAQTMLETGADVITLGNHAFARQEITPFLEEEPRILRPANLAPQTPGAGWGEYDAPFGTVAVVNLIGRLGMDVGPDNPFLAMDRILRKITARVILVDFHAEATSEKLALAWQLDGRVSCVWGTHTHVQTSDAAVLPRGTGCITDLGMTGPALSVLGVKPEQSVAMFRGDPRRRFETAEGPCKLECALFTLDGDTGRCLAAEALRLED